MIARAAPSWQLLLADLSLILFIATAAALANAEEGGERRIEVPVSGAPVAVLRGEAALGDEALLANWLTSYSADPREQLTLTLFYAPGTLDETQARMAGLHMLADEAGHTPRIILEQAPEPALQASFAFDRAPDMARNLQP